MLLLLFGCNWCVLEQAKHSFQLTAHYLIHRQVVPSRRRLRWMHFLPWLTITTVLCRHKIAMQGRPIGVPERCRQYPRALAVIISQSRTIIVLPGGSVTRSVHLRRRTSTSVNMIIIFILSLVARGSSRRCRARPLPPVRQHDVLPVVQCAEWVNFVLPADALVKVDAVVATVPAAVDCKLTQLCVRKRIGHGRWGGMVAVVHRPGAGGR